MTVHQFELDEKYGYVNFRQLRQCRSRRSYRKRFCKCCSVEFWKDFVYGSIPILHWLPRYKWRRDIVSDVIAGLTVGIMHIPQGMAYASLAGLDPVYGLYTSFFPSLFYMVFGTSRHVSLGVFAVISLMVGSVRYREIPHDGPEQEEEEKSIRSSSNRTIIAEDSSSVLTTLLQQQLSSPATTTAAAANTLLTSTNIIIGANSSLSLTTDDHLLDPSVTPIVLTSSLALLVGLVLTALGIFRLGFVSSYLSDQVVSGFTTAGGLHVFTAQLNKFIGVPLPRKHGPGKLFKMYYELCLALPHTKWEPLVLSAVVIALLIACKELINPRVLKYCPVPIPFELLVVIAGTIVSYYFDFENAMKIVGKIPPGLPAPRIPNTSLFPRLIGDAVGIAFVIFGVTVSVGKMFAKKHGYEIDSNQELYALGATEMLSSLFGVYPACCGLARTLVFESAGARTQLSTIFSSALLLIVLLWVGPLFRTLPMCILSAIIVVALKKMVLQLGEIRRLWFISKLDWSIWMMTFLSTTLIDVREGLVVGTVYAMLTLVLRTQWPNNGEEGLLPESDATGSLKRYKEAYPVGPNVTVFKFDAPLLFTNTDKFRSALLDSAGIDLIKAQKLKRRKDKKDAKASTSVKAVKASKTNTTDRRIQPTTTEDQQNGNRVVPKSIGAFPDIYNTTTNNNINHTSLERNGIRNGTDDLSQQQGASSSSKINAAPSNAAPSTAGQQPQEYIIVDCSAISYVDTMGANALKEIYQDMKGIDVEVLFTSFTVGVRDRLERTGAAKEIPSTSIYPYLFLALKAVNTY